MKKIIEIPIAEPSDRGGWKWNREVPRWETYRKIFKNPEKSGQFFEKNSILYVREVNPKYLGSLIDGAVKVAGSVYALALYLSRGDRQATIMRRLIAHFTERKYVHYNTALEHMRMLENYIKTHAIACGLEEDDRITWMPQHVVDAMKVSTLQNYYSKDKSKFMVIDRVLYYLRTRQEVVEALFWKCLHIAGNEYALALETSEGKRPLFYKHKKAFERMSFNSGKTISHFIKVFEKYLDKHPQLFDSKVAL